MNVQIKQSPYELGQTAGAEAAYLIRQAIEEKGIANIILATGTSQFETLNRLINDEGIDWARVVMFHLDEYIGLPMTHAGSFRKYLQDRFLSKVGALKQVHLINGEADPAAECIQLGNAIAKHPVDVALVGIGENGHLAFNDPPADFVTEQPYIVVDLDEPCRNQQYGEGWFSSMNEVPRKAISMSIKQILKSKNIICSVPEERKATAVKNCLQLPVSNLHPASILQQHPACTVYLDTNSAALISPGFV